jgi:hypothetical protein
MGENIVNSYCLRFKFATFGSWKKYVLWLLPSRYFHYLDVNQVLK